MACCFRLYDSQHIHRLVLMQCLAPIIEFGSRYTYLVADWLQYLPKMEEIVTADRSALQMNASAELVRVVFLLSSNVSMMLNL